jgi:hypothetical protein
MGWGWVLSQSVPEGHGSTKTMPGFDIHIQSESDIEHV